MASAKTTSTPVAAKIYDFLVKHQAERQDEKLHPCKSLLEILFYLGTHTGPDISFAVEILSRFVDNSTELHRKDSKRILRYLAGRLGLGIEVGQENLNVPISMTSEPELSKYSNSHWAVKLHTGKSTAGYTVDLNNGLVA